METRELAARSCVTVTQLLLRLIPGGLRPHSNHLGSSHRLLVILAGPRLDQCPGKADIIEQPAIPMITVGAMALHLLSVCLIVVCLVGCVGLGNLLFCKRPTRTPYCLFMELFKAYVESLVSNLGVTSRCSNPLTRLFKITYKDLVLGTPRSGDWSPGSCLYEVGHCGCLDKHGRDGESHG